MADIKERLIERIRDTKNPDILEEIFRLLDMDPGHQEVYELSDEQSKAIEEAQFQIKQGQYLTSEKANEAVREWLEKK